MREEENLCGRGHHYYVAAAIPSSSNQSCFPPPPPPFLSLSSLPFSSFSYLIFSFPLLVSPLPLLLVLQLLLLLLVHLAAAVCVLRLEDVERGASSSSAQERLDGIAPVLAEALGASLVEIV